MANMGVGNKPLMDIGGSNTITDRSVPIQTGKFHFRSSYLSSLQPPCMHKLTITRIADYKRKIGVLAMKLLNSI